MNKLLLVSVSALIASIPAPTLAASKWMDGPPGLPPGSKFRVVSGDPGKEGMFAVRIQLPANYKIAPHSHPTDEIVSVKSGGPLSYGMGDTMDQVWPENKPLGQIYYQNYGPANTTIGN